MLHRYRALFTRNDFTFPFSMLDINAEKIQKNLPGSSDLSGMLDASIGEVLLDLNTHATAKGFCSIIDPMVYRVGSDNFMIESRRFLSGKIITNQIRECETVAVFAATAGSYCEEQASTHFAGGDLLKGYVYDVAGSIIAETAAEEISRYVREIAGKMELEITNRLSPGYCNWDVAEQHTLFLLMEDNQTGIRLTETAMMIPRKSITGIIGLGKNAADTAYPCEICGYENCYLRNKNRADDHVANP